jgi:hypothetical protein
MLIKSFTVTKSVPFMQFFGLKVGVLVCFVWVDACLTFWSGFA